MAKFRIDDEFANLIPEASKEELDLLEGSILTEGCHTPIVVWRGILIDGHRRHKICEKHNIKFQVRKLEVETREEAIQWAITNQLARRNLTPERASYLRGKYYNAEKQNHGGDRASAHSEHLKLPSKKQPNNDKKIKTAEKVARETGVGQATVRRDADFAEAVETLAENIGKEIKTEILDDKVITKKEVVALAKLPAEKQEAAYKKIVAPEEVEESPAEPEDCYGTKVPESLREAWTVRDSIDELLAIARSLKAGIARTIPKAGTTEHRPGWELLQRSEPQITNAMKDIIYYLNEGYPVLICFYCKGKGCSSCSKLGYLPRMSLKGYLANAIHDKRITKEKADEIAKISK